MRYFTGLLLLTIVIASGYLFWSALKKARSRRIIKLRLRTLESGYEEFLAQRKLLAMIREEASESSIPTFAFEALRQLGPHLDALFGILEATPVDHLPDDLTSSLFPNMMAAYRGTLGENGLSERKSQFREAFAEAIEADLSRKILLAQTGSAL